MKGKSKFLAVLILAVCVLFTLAGCKKDKGGDAEAEDGEEAVELVPVGGPQIYTAGMDIVPAITLEAGQGLFDKGEINADGSGTYEYEKIEMEGGPGAAVQSYKEFLSSEEQGYLLIDGETGELAEEPDFTADTGEILLKKESSEEGKLISVGLAWKKKNCTVSVGVAEGQLPKLEEAEPEAVTMNLVEIVDFVGRLSPTDLGLEGNSMDDYEVYAIGGAVLVDNRSCIKINVYSKEDVGSNSIKGEYLLTPDGAHIYELDEELGKVTELTKITDPANTTESASSVEMT